MTASPYNTRIRSGFTLVELSMALVIIGLLIGGLLVGQSLIESSKINAQVKQLQEYDIATRTFRQKYKQWPGDSTYFPHTAGYTEGNGNGFINDHGGNLPPQVLLDEPSRFFNHLYLSGSIKESHSAVYSPIGTGAMPETKISKGRGLTVSMNLRGDLFYFLGIYEIIGGAMAYFQMSQSGIMSPKTAMMLDSKMDDGIFNTGNVRSVTEYTTASNTAFPHYSETSAICTNSGVAYNLNNTSNTACRLGSVDEFI